MQIQFDKPRELKFTLSAIRDMEAQLDGQPLGTVVHNLSRMGINALVVALWAGMKAQDPALSPNLVTKMLQTYLDNGGKVKPLIDGVSEAIKSSGLFNDESTEGNAVPEATGQA